MRKNFGRLCAIARKDAGFTQESAAEIFGISSRSMHDYETGVTKVPDDIAAQMVKSYKTPWLGYIYLFTSTEVGRLILPTIELKELSSSILNWQVHMKKANDMQYDIAEVGSDNRIDSNEQPIYKKCISTINMLIGAAFSVVMAPIVPNKKAAPVGAGNGLIEKIFTRTL